VAKLPNFASAIYVQSSPLEARQLFQRLSVSTAVLMELPLKESSSTLFAILVATTGVLRSRRVSRQRCGHAFFANEMFNAIN
jgi:hypothetical protein